METTQVKEVKQFSLNLRDFIQGIYVSVIAPIIGIILEQLQVGNFNLNWKELGILALTTFAGYLLKNFLQPTKVIIEQPKDNTAQVVKRLV